MADRPPIGARVVVGGRHRATLRYLGPVEGQAGEWAGLEWDEASRGKHDGALGGRAYFSTRGGLPSASFVRLPKLLETADLGCTLLEAARERYAGSGGSGAGSGASPQRIPEGASGGTGVAMQLVGAEEVARRPSRLEACRQAVLCDGRVARLGDAAELAAALPHLEELDLSGNLVADWSFVQQLASTLPRLHTLILSRNPLQLPALAPLRRGGHDPSLQSLTTLRTLVLNGCSASWPNVVAAAAQLPALQQLRLCSNGIASLALPGPAPASGGAAAAAGAGEPLGAPAEQRQLQQESADGHHHQQQHQEEEEHSKPGVQQQQEQEHSSPSAERLAEERLAAAFGSLELLDLDDNQLESWGEVQLLRRLPRLASLQLSGNRLGGVQYTSGFGALTCLLLGRNALSSWEAVSALDALPALREVRLSGNPLPASTLGDARYEVIARVGSLAALNGSVVGSAERWDAELAYLRRVTDALAEAGSDSPVACTARAALLVAHPRFPALSAKYGPLAPPLAGASGGAAGSALSRSMAEVVICQAGRQMRKKLPVSLTVGRLKLMLEKLLRLKAAQQALLLVPPPGSEAQPEDITDEEGRELRYFGVADGCRLEVREADQAARASALDQAKGAAAQLHQLRMEEQERSIQQLRVAEQQLMA